MQSVKVETIDIFSSGKKSLVFCKQTSPSIKLIFLFLTKIWDKYDSKKSHALFPNVNFFTLNSKLQKFFKKTCCSTLGTNYQRKGKNFYVISKKILLIRAEVCLS